MERPVYDQQGYVGDGRRLAQLFDVSRRLRRSRRRREQRRLRRRGWYDPQARSHDEAIFIGGCGRSGTSLFRELLIRHPRIACGPETSMFGLPFDVGNIAPAWQLDEGELRRLAGDCANLVAFSERFYRRFLLEPLGKERWADKTPNNVRAIARLLTWYPRSRFIHVIRDGRDVVCSLRHHPRERIIGGRVVPVDRTQPIAKCATRWLNDTAQGLAYRGHPRYLEVRYEELVSDPRKTLLRACEFLGEDFDPRMLDLADSGVSRIGRLLNNANAAELVTATSVGRWARDLSPAERRDVANIAGELLEVLGYTEPEGWVERGGADRAVGGPL